MGIIQDAGCTCTTMFLLPFLKIPKEDLVANGFLDAYLGDVEAPVHYEEALYLLFQPKNKVRFEDFFAKQTNMKNSLLVDDYDPANGFVVLVYRIPEKYIMDYKLFLEGKYSHFSEGAKEAIPKQVKFQDKYGRAQIETSLQHKIINKDRFVAEKLEQEFDVVIEKDQEVWEVPNMKKEMLDIKKITQ